MNIDLKTVKDFDNCPYCGSDIKKEGNSLHAWDIEYKCGLHIWGAVDTKTHGNEIGILEKCKKDDK